MRFVGSTGSGIIRLTLSRLVEHTVIKERTTTNLMSALLGMYEKLFANNKVHLMKNIIQFEDVDRYVCCPTPK